MSPTPRPAVTAVAQYDPGAMRRVLAEHLGGDDHAAELIARLDGGARADHPVSTGWGPPDVQHVWVRDAELCVFDPVPGTDDASATYILEAFGISTQIRLRDTAIALEHTTARGAVTPYVHVDRTGPGLAKVDLRIAHHPQRRIRI